MLEYTTACKGYSDCHFVRC